MGYVKIQIRHDILVSLDRTASIRSDDDFVARQLWHLTLTPSIFPITAQARGQDTVADLYE